MSKLVSNTPFNGYDREFDGLAIREISGFEIISLAAAQGEETAFAKAFKKVYKTALPEPGTFAKLATGKILWTGQNQYFLFDEGEDDSLDETLAEKFSGKAYATLQTDGWAALEISGKSVHDVMERFMPLDIRSKKIGFGARTSAHHTAVIILKTGTKIYQLLTPRSSSGSFLEGLEHVAEHIQIET